MILAIVGTRHAREWGRGLGLVHEALEASPWRAADITMVVTGCALGVDALAAQWARYKGISYFTHVARWEAYGEKAGPMRNQALIQGPPTLDGLLAIWDGRPKGTADAIARARKAGIPVHIFRIEPPKKKRRTRRPAREDSQMSLTQGEA
jgi:hypothetical protein